MTDVPPKEWLSAADALKTAGFTFFDWLGCVDEIGRRDCFRVVLLVRNLAAKAEPLMLNCWLPRDDPRIDTVRSCLRRCRVARARDCGAIRRGVRGRR